VQAKYKMNNHIKRNISSSVQDARSNTHVFEDFPVKVVHAVADHIGSDLLYRRKDSLGQLVRPWFPQGQQVTLRLCE
jgi:macrodomain Ter protein organizer (MatP/YcbG family)